MIFQFGRFTLDTDRCELKAGADVVALEPRAFSLLQFLIENREKMVSKEEIIEQVWDGRIVSDSALATCVNAVRNAVGDDGKSQTMIKTFPRRGLRFVADVNDGRMVDEAVVHDRGTTPTDRSAPATRRYRMPVAAAVLAVLIVVGGLALWRPWIERVDAASVERMAFPLPDRPSIAVLPFTNLSGDATQDYLGDAINENITTSLSKLRNMFVIAATSTRVYQDRDVDVRQVAEELGVRYVLEGSVQQSGDQVRVMVRLIDALEGHNLWAERYDRELDDVLALQDDIAVNVLMELEVELTEGERAFIQRGNTDSLQAYQLFRQGLDLYFHHAHDSNEEARALFRQAVEADPDYAVAWTMLGFTHYIAAGRGWSEDPEAANARAEELAHKAIALDPTTGAPYQVLMLLAMRRGQYDEAILHGERAVALNPNNVSFSVLLGRNLARLGRAEEGLEMIQQAIRHDPFAPARFFRWQGSAYHLLGRYDEAIAAFEHAHEDNPQSALPLGHLALTYADMGQLDEASAAARDILELDPDFSARAFVRVLNRVDPADAERDIATLVGLGLPE